MTELKHTPAQKKVLKKLQIEVNDNGFSIWLTEKREIKGKVQKYSYWVIDASLIKKDGKIRLGDYFGHPVNAVFDVIRNEVQIVKTKSKKTTK